MRYPHFLLISIHNFAFIDNLATGSAHSLRVKETSASVKLQSFRFKLVDGAINIHHNSEVTNTNKRCL